MGKTDWVNVGCYVFIGMFIICALAMTFGSGDQEYEEYRSAKKSFFEQRDRERERPLEGSRSSASIFGSREDGR